ncbi:YdjY domain-containing protein [Kiritimatiellota bacterium B12222]|nr:YdjY domain-containing protein [Kiritimatiellota bacterium B12222]
MTNTLSLLAALFTQFLTQTAPLPDEDTGAASIKPQAEANFAAVSEKINGVEGFWSAPFVVADLTQKEVTIWGQHTGMSTGEPIEFFIISELSGHDYESLMISFAKPSDIHQALEKIGAEAGGPVSPDEHRFWPRGSRIVAEIEWITNGQTQPQRMPVESVVLTDGSPMALTPWVFTGSPMLPNFEKEGSFIYGADLYSPNSIASTFNLQSTVLDLPFQGSKTQTYGNFIRNPAVDAPKAQPMLIHLRLATAEEAPAEIDLHLQFSGEEGHLNIDGMPEELQATGLAELGAFMNTREHEMHYLSPDFGPELSISKTTQLARELQLLETHVPSVRIEPPVDGQFFFKAFVPDPRYRTRDNRPTQPIELHFSQAGGQKWMVTLSELEEVWGDGMESSIVEKVIPLDSPADFEAYLQNPEKQKPVLFVYTKGNLSYGELQKWVSPVLDQFPIVFVYEIED